MIYNVHFPQYFLSDDVLFNFSGTLVSDILDNIWRNQEVMWSIVILIYDWFRHFYFNIFVEADNHHSDNILSLLCWEEMTIFNL